MGGGPALEPVREDTKIRQGEWGKIYVGRKRAAPEKGGGGSEKKKTVKSLFAGVTVYCYLVSNNQRGKKKSQITKKKSSILQRPLKRRVPLCPAKEEKPVSPARGGKRKETQGLERKRYHVAQKKRGMKETLLCNGHNRPMKIRVKIEK